MSDQQASDFRLFFCFLVGKKKKLIYSNEPLESFDELVEAIGETNANHPDSAWGTYIKNGKAFQLGNVPELYLDIITRESRFQRQT